MIKAASRRDEAELVALEALAYIASFPEVFSDFLRLTGFAYEDLVQGAATQEVQNAALDFLTRNESLLISFCSHRDYEPARIYAALKALDPAVEVEMPAARPPGKKMRR